MCVYSNRKALYTGCFKYISWNFDLFVTNFEDDKYSDINVKFLIRSYFLSKNKLGNRFLRSEMPKS